MPKDNGYATRDKEIERLRRVLARALASLKQLATHPVMPPALQRAVAREAGAIEADLEKK